MKEKVVLAYSGGLDTTAIIPWLKENFDYEVICVCVNCGQAEELDGLEERAKACGASKLYIEDVIDEFCDDYIVPCVQAHAVYENKYLLGTSMARPLIAKKLVEIARKEGAVAICHGATGKGNDQIRFELGIKALAPDIKIIAPWRSDKWNMDSRESEIEYCKAHGIQLPFSTDSSYSRDRNIWHISHEFVSEQAKEYDTYGKKRKFTTVQGIELNLSSGAYGWKTDREEEIKALTEAIQNGETVDKEPAYISKGAQKGSNDIGNSYVEIDLTNQHLYLFKDGDIVLETDFVSGNMSKADCVTPPGVFGLTYKTRNAILRGANYETPVNYWMPFNGNVGMHDATWRRAFGGTIYLTSGSHGCINLPLHMAASIYEYVSTGFPVVCYYY